MLEATDAVDETLDSPITDASSSETGPCCTQCSAGKSPLGLSAGSSPGGLTAFGLAAFEPDGLFDGLFGGVFGSDMVTLSNSLGLGYMPLARRNAVVRVFLDWGGGGKVTGTCGGKIPWEYG